MREHVRVFVRADDYRAAVEGLPLAAELVDRPSGAVVVIDGRGDWWRAAAAAAADGASALLIAEPVVARPEAVAELAEGVAMPVIVNRARLRHDLVRAAIERRHGMQPRVLVAECTAAATVLPTMVRDSVGWLRELAGGPLRTVSAAVGSTGGTALVRTIDTGLAGTLVITAARLDAGGVLRVQGLGEIRTELELDISMRSATLATSTAEGRLVDPALFETPERASLRRAIDVVTGRDTTRDLDDLRHDVELARDILGGDLARFDNL